VPTQEREENPTKKVGDRRPPFKGKEKKLPREKRGGGEWDWVASQEKNKKTTLLILPVPKGKRHAESVARRPRKNRIAAAFGRGRRGNTRLADSA